MRRMRKVLFFDSTMRDGSHAVKHQIPIECIAEYCRLIDDAGMYTTMIGHGNGLGASSLQVGLSRHSDEKMLAAGRNNLSRTKLGVYMIPGFATIKEHMLPAMELGAEIFCIGCHCTEADITRQHIEFARARGKETYGVLMMYHMASAEELLSQALKMQSYGAAGVILMDSAGASTPELVRRAISALVDGLEIKVGFHPHNNLGLAVANAYSAIQEGASIIDGTLRGFGAGAGNCPLEALAALLQKENIPADVDLYRLLDGANMIADKLIEPSTGLSDISIVSGIAGVFSSFATQVKHCAEEFDVDARDIFLELGRRKVVAGQEDVILEIAMALQRKRSEEIKEYLLQSLL